MENEIAQQFNCAFPLIQEALTINDNIAKPSTDNRQYRSIILPNGISAILVHDPETDKGAAAMDVKVGHFSDPEEIPGLAHFLEHMLFLGTEKYPSENHYNSFLSRHGGHANAYTSKENTNYYFEVNVANLKEALDIFAQFFIAPLFTESATDREMNAVHNENAKNLQSDSWRMFQLIKSISVDGGPFHKFGTGNLETLKTTPEQKNINVRNSLLSFYAKYYSASVMKLVVVGNQPLYELQKWVIEMFSPIVNTNITNPVFESYKKGKYPYDDSSLGSWISVVPIKNIRKLTLLFPLYSTETIYQSKPSNHLSHLIGHEGKGSILSLLKSLGLANALSAGASRRCSIFELFSIEIDLTPAGLESMSQIIEIVFAYIAVLKQEPYRKAIHDELATMGQIEFRFKPKARPIDTASRIAANMQIFNIEHILSGEDLVTEFNPELIDRQLSLLIPENLITIVTAVEFSETADKEEKWYGTKYTQRKFTKEEIELWNNSAYLVEKYSTRAITRSLHLPEPNPFLPSNFDLLSLPPGITKVVESCNIKKNDVQVSMESKPTPACDIPISEPLSTPSDSQKEPGVKPIHNFHANTSEFPGIPSSICKGSVEHLPTSDSNSISTVEGYLQWPKLIESDYYNLWYSLDPSFGEPRATIQVTLVTPLVYSSPKTLVETHLYCDILEEQLSEFAYDATISGLRYSISYKVEGISIFVSGFHHKIVTLLLTIINKMKSLEFNDIPTFNRLKESLRRHYDNFFMGQPYEITRYYLDGFLLEKKYMVEDKKKALEGVTLEDVALTAKFLLREIHIVALVHGNINESDGINAIENVWNILNPKSIYPKHLFPVQRIVQLQHKMKYVFQINAMNQNNNNSALYYYIQTGIRSMKKTVTLDLLATILKEPIFDSLRTKQQLGYIVWSGIKHMRGTDGFFVRVQSSTYTPMQIMNCIEDFMSGVRQLLVDMEENKFETYRLALIAHKLQKLHKLSERTSRIWQEIETRECIYDRYEREAEILKHVTKRMVISIFKCMFKSKIPAIEGTGSDIEAADNTFPTVSIQLFGANATMETPETDEEITMLSDWYRFKKESVMFPLTPVYISADGSCLTNRDAIDETVN